MTGDDGACKYWTVSQCEGTVHCPPRCPRFIDERGTPWRTVPYEPAHWEALLAMYVDFAPEDRAQGVPPLAEHRIEQWLERLLEEGCNFVARSGDSVVGHAVYTPTDADEPELAVFVHQDYRNRGIGTELCKHVIATAAAADRDGLVLEAQTRNRIAIKMYEKLGFERADGSSTSNDIDRQSDTFRMRLPLTKPSVIETQQPPLLRG